MAEQLLGFLLYRVVIFRTYVYRELSLPEADGNQVLSTQLDGRTIASGNRGGQVEIKGIDPIAWYTVPPDDEYSIAASRITLHFPKGAGLALLAKAILRLSTALRINKEMPGTFKTPGA